MNKTIFKLNIVEKNYIEVEIEAENLKSAKEKALEKYSSYEDDKDRIVVEVYDEEEREKVSLDQVKVYAESNSHAELWATFESEELYLLCLPALEKEANECGMFITESVREES